MDVAIMIGGLGFLSGTLFIIGLFFYLKSSGFLENVIENVIDDVSKDENLQKNLFTVGGFLGNGIKAGVGLQSSGRTNWKTAAIEIAGQFLLGKQGIAPAAGAQIGQQVANAVKDNFFK